MIFEIIHNKKMLGFSYYPLIEICLGIFFLFMAFFIPLLFYRYNGLKLSQWDEWLFLIIFFLLFLFLGINLSYQNLKVTIIKNEIKFFQDMRSPTIELKFTIDSWRGNLIKVKELSKTDKEFFYSIYIITEKSEELFYETRSKSESQKILDSLNKLYNLQKGENDGKQ